MPAGGEGQSTRRRCSSCWQAFGEHLGHCSSCWAACSAAHRPLQERNLFAMVTNYAVLLLSDSRCNGRRRATEKLGIQRGVNSNKVHYCSTQSNSNCKCRQNRVTSRTTDVQLWFVEAIAPNLMGLLLTQFLLHEQGLPVTGCHCVVLRRKSMRTWNA